MTDSGSLTSEPQHRHGFRSRISSRDFPSSLSVSAIAFSVTGSFFLLVDPILNKCISEVSNELEVDDDDNSDCDEDEELIVLGILILEHKCR